jgi:hypothetical protein
MFYVRKRSKVSVLKISNHNIDKVEKAFQKKSPKVLRSCIGENIVEYSDGHIEVWDDESLTREFITYREFEELEDFLTVRSLNI